MNIGGVLRAIRTHRRPFGMSSAPGAPVLEGVFAINKPPAITSAQVIRDVQSHFDPSDLFKPWLDREQARKNAESHNQKQKRRWRGRRMTSVKMGHGGTLDPMATGVLVLGLGSGTKQLHFFSDQCTKSYEAVLLFGAATDTYDTEGKIVSRKAFDHVTKDLVEEALAEFRGKIMQRPPIFSALRVQGKRLYEYAREGIEVPVEIQARPVEVHSLEIVEWMEGSTHQWHWPGAEAEQETKQIAARVLGVNTDSQADPSGAAGLKRKHSQEPHEPSAAAVSPSTKKQKPEDDRQSPDRDSTTAPRQASPKPPDKAIEGIEVRGEAEDVGIPTKEIPISTSECSLCPAPACRIRMTVTSGFYVRSLCHDLGAAVGSLGTMASLVRTRQGEFELETNVLQYDALGKGEDVWGPQVKAMLQSWESGKLKSSG